MDEQREAREELEALAREDADDAREQESGYVDPGSMFTWMLLMPESERNAPR